MKKLLIFAVAVAFSIGANAGDCRKTNSVCSDQAAVKIISGVNVPSSVVGGCWQYTDTYDCLASGGPDYCAPLVVAGCQAMSSVCSTTAFNGTCEAYTKTYRCGNSIGTPSNTIKLNDSYTLVQDTLNRSACSALDTNASCVVAETTCTEGPETRIVNGMSVYKACWKYEDKFTCSAGTFANYCAPLQSMDCAETGNVCKIWASWAGGPCLEYERTFNCNAKPDPVPTGVTYLNSSYTITGDTTTSTCTDSESNPNCTLAGTVCSEGPETRIINGLPVFKDCWKTDKEYTCASSALTSTCADLMARPECIETTTPLCVDLLPGGQCGVLEHTYECSIGDEVTQTATDCSTQKFCIGGTCFDTNYSPDTDFGMAVAGMEAAREAAEYGIFKGTADKCSRGYLGLKNCCAASSGGATANNSVIADTAGSIAFQAAGQTVKAYGSTYLFEGLYNTASMMGSDILESYAFSALAWGAATPSVTVWGVTASWGVSAADAAAAAALGAEATPGLMLAFDPWSLALSVAIYVIMQMMTCEEEDQLTAMKRGQGLCHKVGSYCDSEVLGACVKKMESYCCFPSKLGKIINQQGRPQVGKSWGDAENPDCSGFTLEQLTQIDFSVMDFSEFIRSIPILNKDASGATGEVLHKAGSGFVNPTGSVTP